MFNLFSQHTKSFKSLSGKEFKAEFDKSDRPVLLDVRTPAEFASGTIPTARNVDFMSPDFNEEITKLDKNKEYFLFCRSGNRSGQACKTMSELGFTVYNLKGGIGEWPV